MSLIGIAPVLSGIVIQNSGCLMVKKENQPAEFDQNYCSVLRAFV
jgi:hypothetical protein